MDWNFIALPHNQQKNYVNNMLMDLKRANVNVLKNLRDSSMDEFERRNLQINGDISKLENLMTDTLRNFMLNLDVMTYLAAEDTKNPGQVKLKTIQSLNQVTTYLYRVKYSLFDLNLQLEEMMSLSRYLTKENTLNVFTQYKKALTVINSYALVYVTKDGRSTLTTSYGKDDEYQAATVNLYLDDILPTFKLMENIFSGIGWTYNIKPDYEGVERVLMQSAQEKKRLEDEKKEAEKKLEKNKGEKKKVEEKKQQGTPKKKKQRN